MPDPDLATTAATEPMPWWRAWVSRPLLVAIPVGTLTFLWWVDPRTCTEQVAAEGSSAVTLCQPLGLGSPQLVLVAAAFVVLLLLTELSSFSFGGLELKRDIDGLRADTADARADAAQARADTATLATVVQTQLTHTTAVTSKADATGVGAVHNYIGLTPETLAVAASWASNEPLETVARLPRTPGRPPAEAGKESRRRNPGPQAEARLLAVSTFVAGGAATLAAAGSRGLIGLTGRGPWLTPTHDPQSLAERLPENLTQLLDDGEAAGTTDALTFRQSDGTGLMVVAVRDTGGVPIGALAALLATQTGTDRLTALAEELAVLATSYAILLTDVLLTDGVDPGIGDPNGAQ